MTVDITLVVVAAIGAVGTLSSPILGQWIAARAKQQEFDLQRRRLHEERDEARQQTTLEERRSTYVQLNTTARRYQQALDAYLRMITSDVITDEGRGELTEARKSYRDIYSAAQMILPDNVLDEASAVSAALAKAYGIVMRLEVGNPEARSPGAPEETTEEAADYIRIDLYNEILELRYHMRVDLGVSDPDGPTRSGRLASR
jgi:type II secretory pathway pseudopilin PulG